MRTTRPKLSLPSSQKKGRAEAPNPAKAQIKSAAAVSEPAARNPLINRSEKKGNPPSTCGCATTTTPRAVPDVAVIKMRKELAKRFPNCFAGFKQPKRPLKIGIHLSATLAAPELPRHIVFAAITDYVTGPSYLTALIEGATRINLNGEAVGVVTAADEQHAQRRLAKQARVSSKREEAAS